MTDQERVLREEALTVLREIMKDDTNTPALRCEAAKQVLYQTDTSFAPDWECTEER